MTRCTVDSCEREHHGHGLCQAHCDRRRRGAVVHTALQVSSRHAVDPAPVADVLRSAPAYVLAERFGVTKRSIQRWRAGRPIRVDLADQIAVALGRHIDELWAS